MSDPPSRDLAPSGEAQLDPWDALIGPFHDDVGLAQILGMTPETLLRHVVTGAVLCTVTADGTRLYPQFQFGPAGDLLPHLTDVLSALRLAGRDDWGHAQWLTAPVDRYGGRSAATMLRDGDAERVIADAARDARRWSR
ncbi:hypothetical protein [Cryobacterium sp. AP23]